MLNHIVPPLALTLILVLPQEKSIPPVTGTLIRGDNYAFSISAPAGWAIDTARWVDQGLKAGIYPRSEEVGMIPPIFVLIATKKVEGKETLKNLLTYSTKLATEQRIWAKITDIQDFAKTQDNKTVLVRRYEKADAASLEAYIDDVDIVALITLQPSSKDRFEKVLPVFRDLLRSYVSVQRDTKPTK